jgi:suppressor of G2 allele of SKP1
MVTFPTTNGEHYTLAIDPLFAKVDLAKTKFAVLRNGIEFKLKKAVPGKWGSLHGSAADNTSSVYSRPVSGITPTVSDSKSVSDASSLISEVPTTIVRPPSDPTPSQPTPKGPVYPTSSKSGPKDWDKIASESLHPKKEEKKKTTEGGAPEDEEEDSDDGGGGDGVDKFFRKLYRNADEDTRRAMMKSFTESDGTALSTNWSEVKKGKVEAKPPSDD